MSVPVASSSLRSLRSVTVFGPVQASGARSYASLAPYSPPSSDYLPARRPNRPSSSEFFTGRPRFHESLTQLQETITSAKRTLRSKFVYPLPSELPHLNPPQTNWLAKDELSNILDVKLRTNTLRQVVELLTELNHLRHVSELAGQHGLVGDINRILSAYERTAPAPTTVDGESGSGSGGKSEVSGIDQFGRSHAMGRKKTSSARVWLIPSQTLRSITNTNTNSDDSTSTADISGQSGQGNEILINHIPLSQYFVRPSDRETILRPLKITGYLGAFNIFGFSRGGGMSSQASAVGLAVARALGGLRDDARDILQAGE
uniref:Uncharacterized protein n=1 Tax=Kwoniella dejecticola CBS 10117 TaxID=1296121 RepID=A0A1A6A155_9TREE|nr:uncharacterized protein I303_06059 [Kwoniella dejecticola CBS 10117]OBR83777.1 hypothetical protein I303_06059 [Kwoniella dejecticola CBS 10117]